MFKFITVLIALMVFTSCDSAPAPSVSVSSPPTKAGSIKAVTKNAEPFTITSELADAAAGSVLISIKVPVQATPQDVRLAAESVIVKRTGQYSTILVESYVEGAAAGLPLAVSKFDGGKVHHVFNNLPQKPQRIPTH